jgi:hypothetical protein
MAIYKKRDISPIEERPPPGGTPGQPGDPGDDEGGDPVQPGNDDGLDDIDKRIEDMLKKRKGIDKEDPNAPPAPGSDGKDKGDVQYKDDKANKAKVVKPAFSWKQLLEQFVTTAADTVSTYAKLNTRKAATGASIGAQVGAQAVAKGQKPDDEVAFKLLIVFDTSGSMSKAIDIALAETKSLLAAQTQNINGHIGICFFADRYKLYGADLGNNKAWRVTSTNELENSPPTVGVKSLTNEVLASRLTGGTMFTQGLVSQISACAAKGYNVIIFSDSGILGDAPENLVNLKKLYNSYRSNIFFIADTSATYNELIKTLGVSNTFGHLPS